MTKKANKISLAARKASTKLISPHKLGKTMKIVKSRWTTVKVKCWMMRTLKLRSHQRVKLYLIVAQCLVKAAATTRRSRTKKRGRKLRALLLLLMKISLTCLTLILMRKRIKSLVHT